MLEEPSPGVEVWLGSKAHFKCRPGKMGGKAPGEGWGRQASSECSLTLGEGSVLVWRGCGQPRAQIQILREFSGRNTLEGCVGIKK